MNAPQRKLTDDQMQEIAWKFKTKSATQLELAEEYGVAQSTISAVCQKTRLKEKKAMLESLPRLSFAELTGETQDGHVKRIVPYRPARELSGEVLVKILERIMDGTSVRNACFLEQVAPITLTNAIAKYPDIKQQVDEARAYAQEDLRKLAFHAARNGTGSPGTLLKFLERTNPEDFAPPAQEIRNTGGNTTNVLVSIAPAPVGSPDAPVRIASRAALIAIARGETAPQLPSGENERLEQISKTQGKENGSSDGGVNLNPNKSHESSEPSRGVVIEGEVLADPHL